MMFTPERLAELAHMQAVIDFEESARFLPSTLKKTLLAMMTVDHYRAPKGFKDLQAYLASATQALKVPSDIKSYLESGAAARMKSRGVKASKEWLEANSQRALDALRVLPVPIYKVDSKEKARHCANQIVIMANAQLKYCVNECFDYKAAALKLIDRTGVLRWNFAFVPNFTKDNQDEYWLGVIARLIDEKWWTRKIYRAAVRAYEDARRAAGMVSPESGNPYCSKGQLAYFKTQLEQQTEWLDKNVMRRADGVEVPLKQIFEASVANPEVRRAELMQRINGMQEIAEENGDIGLFVTMTTPSRFHRKTKRGKYWRDNPKYDGSTTREAQQWLSQRWALIRSALNDANIEIMGFRVAEPHADGCPHWHMLLFVAPVFKNQTIQIMRTYMHLSNKGAIRAIARGCQTTKQDRLELDTEKAKNARFDCKAIDKAAGCAAAYIAKYIAKNIDAHGLDEAVDFETNQRGMKENALRVRAWASCHGIRQFQQIGGAPVTVWRELRRIKDELESPKFEKMRRAAGLRESDEHASYAEYARLNRFGCVRLLKVPHENGYGELTEKVIGLQGLGLEVVTHADEWEIAPLGAEECREADSTWINGNNCRLTFENGKPLSAAAKYTLLEMEIERPSLSNWSYEDEFDV